MARKMFDAIVSVGKDLGQTVCNCKKLCRAKTSGLYPIKHELRVF